LNQAFEKMALSLPCIHYFGRLALQLSSAWEKIDDKVQALTCDDFEVSQVFNWVEDQNELLLYIGDILA